MPHASIPPRVQFHIDFHTAKVTQFNAAVAECRSMGMQFGSPGRYEWEYRLAHEAEADTALALLAQVEALAATNGVSLEALYGPQRPPIKASWSAEAPDLAAALITRHQQGA